jgi:hypothetical protein
MEATRRGDELRAEAGSAEPVLVFSGEEEAPPVGPGPAHELVVAAAVARVEALEAVEPAPEARSDPAAARAVCSQAVVVDGDLAGLEWLKASLAGSFARVHLFQTAEGAIPRIRQYLMRGEVPAVLLSPRAPMDPLSGIDRAADLLRRLRALSPRMPLLLVAEEGAPPPAEARLADAVLWRPGATALLGRAGEPARAAAARALRDRVAPYARR